MSRAHEVGALALQRAFGSGVVCAVASVDGDTRSLWPAERELVAAAVPARRREFAAGRVQARALLERLGFAAGPLLAHRDRAPRWPPGAIGSITHDARVCVVAATRAGHHRALGVDVERDEALEESLWPMLLVRRELEWLASRPVGTRGRLARLLFSAKECVYKGTRGFAGRPLVFHDLEVTLDPVGGSFRARRIGTNPAGVTFAGFHLTCAGSLVTGVALPTRWAPHAFRDGRAPRGGLFAGAPS